MGPMAHGMGRNAVNNLCRAGFSASKGDPTICTTHLMLQATDCLSGVRLVSAFCCVVLCITVEEEQLPPLSNTIPRYMLKQCDL